MKVKAFRLAIPLLALISCDSLSQQQSKQETNRIQYCEELIPDQLIPRLNREFIDLEKYFIEKGLLKDSSGTSYYDVYHLLVTQENLGFNIDEKFKLLDSLSDEPTQLCLFRLLNDSQRKEILQKHVDSSNDFLNQGYQGNVTVGMIAENIVDTFSPQDFDLKLFKLGSLLAFHRIGTPLTAQKAFSGNPNQNDFNNAITIKVTEEDQIIIDDQVVSFDQIKTDILEFIRVDPIQRSVHVIASRNAGYEIFSNLIDTIDETYSELHDEASGEHFNKTYSELTKDQQRAIDTYLPKNIQIDEPK